MTSPTLFPGDAPADPIDAFGPPVQWDLPVDEHGGKVVRSALWSAYGDALGWISELADEERLKQRTSGQPLIRPIPWQRRIGGIGGITASLPSGCYSDDTQLRLATCRSIRADGFDVEAFASVELPVWLSYALGGGKGTSAAAANLSKPKGTWFANEFKGWTDSGGNGAAMRIQPHVWSAHSPENPESFLPDVIRNAVCTHSHPTGIMGAVFHALTLARTLTTGLIPSPKEADDAVMIAAQLPALMANDFEVWNYWRTAFERSAGSFQKGWERATSECRQALQKVIVDTAGLTGAERYSAIVDCLNLRDHDKRGNGILTAVAATGLAWCEERPEEALRIAANAIGTDTDTIGTMAGAILGVAADAEPPTEVMDAVLIRSEANRLSKIAQRGRPNHYRYPDLLHWSAPRTRSDALMTGNDGNLWVCGLGRAEAIGEPIAAPKGDFKWQWLHLDFGQTLLIKRRNKIPRLPAPTSPSQPPEQRPELSRRPVDLEAALKYVKDHDGDDKAIGMALRAVISRGTTGQIAGFTAALIDHIRDMKAGQGNAGNRGP